MKRLRSTPSLDCYLFDGWKPRVRPAQRRRDWMDATPESFAYRCLPLAIANAHGWEIGGGAAFRARWHGGSGVEDVEIELDGDCEAIDAPVSLFGQGVLTFHIAGLFRTSPGWNLWVSGSPNHIKDGIAALTGIIETDWSPYSFTMNWRFTRPGHWVRFEIDEPICFFLPSERGVVDDVMPRFLPISAAPELERQFRTWSASRDAFQARMKAEPPASPADKWQKLYYRGVDADGRQGTVDHQSKLRARMFATPSHDTDRATCPATRPHAGATGALDDDRLLRIQQELRSLAPRPHAIQRVDAIDAERFLERHYAVGWPLRLTYRPANETSPDVHALLRDLDALSPEGASHIVEAPVACLTARDVARFSALLLMGDPDGSLPVRVARAGAATPLVQEPANRFHLQLAGRSRMVLEPPSPRPSLDADAPCDLLAAADLAKPPRDDAQRPFDITIDAGEAVFVPIGWWSQTCALEDGASLSRTDFRWRNDWLATAQPG